jgi:hypothetical protein
MSDNFQQTVDLRDQLEKQRAGIRPKKVITPLEEIYEDSRAAETKKDFNKIDRPAVKFTFNPKLFRLIVFVIAFIVVGITAYNIFFKGQSGFEPALKGVGWYAVKLVNGEIYYGQIKDTKADPVVMSNVYYNYDQTKAKTEDKAIDETSSLRLVKRGQETHGPSGTMDIVRAQVLFMEPLKTDSKVLKAILQYENKP